MKITAYFNSPDSADFAMGALKRSLSPLSKIETHNRSIVNSNTDTIIFPVFNLSSVTPSYSVAVQKNSSDSVNQNDECILEVVCRNEEAEKASRIIIGFGGRNISRI